jgi:hypothetical protein
MLGLSIAGPMWSQRVRHEREQQLLRMGALYAQAIAAYYNASPGSLKQYPPSMSALLSDSRFVGTRRYMRQLYPDPVNPGQPWGLVLDPQQRIIGVYSRSEAAPIAEGRLDLGVVRLDPAKHYSDWKFLAQVADATGTPQSH